MPAGTFIPLGLSGLLGVCRDAVHCPSQEAPAITTGMYGPRLVQLAACCAFKPKTGWVATSFQSDGTPRELACTDDPTARHKDARGETSGAQETRFSSGLLTGIFIPDPREKWFPNIFVSLDWLSALINHMLPEIATIPRLGERWGPLATHAEKFARREAGFEAVIKPELPTSD